ncbi:MAG: hypothetical protein MK212_01495 [Saprospiraceae bacterium]|nr:hypothetical protein [Saprospiraceae bacterium]
MRKILYLLTLQVLAVCSASMSLAQDASYIQLRITNSDLVEKENPFIQLNAPLIVNGVEIDWKSDQTYTIPTSNYTSRLDIIHYGEKTIYTKFKPDEEYLIKISRSCSYELMPANGGQVGTFHYEFTNYNPGQEYTLFTEHGKDSEGGLQLSTLCPFSAQKFVILDQDYDPYSIYMDGEIEDDNHILGETYFHFLHGERISIRHNVKMKRTSVRHDGYIEEGKSFKDYVIEVEYVQEE